MDALGVNVGYLLMQLLGIVGIGVILAAAVAIIVYVVRHFND